MKKIVLLYFLQVSIFPVLLFAANYDLTGIWQDDNGTQYRVRTIDNRVFWYMDGRPYYINVFCGTINGDIVNGQWADVPGGNKSLNNGNLTLRIDSNTRMTIIEGSNYGGNLLIKQTPNIKTVNLGRQTENWRSLVKGDGPLVFHLEPLGGWRATWTQRPAYDLPQGMWTGPVFDERAVKGSDIINKVVNITIDEDDQVTVINESSEDGVRCNFNGKIFIKEGINSKKEVWVKGTYVCNGSSQNSWEARITRGFE